MPQDQERSNVQRNGRQSSVLKSLANQEKRKPLLRPVRKSARLQKIQRKTQEQNHLLPPPSASNSFGEEACPVLPRDSPALETSPDSDRKRKRSQEAEGPLPQIRDRPSQEQVRTSFANPVVEDTSRQEEIGDKNINPVNHWTQEGTWPKEYFQPDPNMSQPLSRNNSHSALSYSQSVRNGENPPAYSPEYEDVLAQAGIFMHQCVDVTISDTSKELCTALLLGEHKTPEHSLFQGDSFWITLDRVRSRNEARVLRDITPSIVPSAELLYMRGLSHLQHLNEEINVQWTKCMCLAGPRPQPDFAVGFMSSAFAEDEIKKLKSYTAPEKATLFTGNLYFPFLMCEVKCGENGLNIADRQNAHSASMAINAILQLYRTVSRVEELHREILAFSISHDHGFVRIYGHYALINGIKTTSHRHLIREFSFVELGGHNKWIAYKFTRNIYDIFVPFHLDRIRSVITQLPNPRLESFTSIPSTENKSELANSRQMAASASSSQATGSFKKLKLQRMAMLQQELERSRLEKEQQKQETERQMKHMEGIMKQMQEQIIHLLKGQQNSAKE